jgi:hypothetical protein
LFQPRLVDEGELTGLLPSHAHAAILWWLVEAESLSATPPKDIILYTEKSGIQTRK